LLAVAGLVVLAAGAIGAGNTIGFAVRSASLERDWRSQEAAGVPAGRLAAPRAELAAMRSRWVGPFPYPLASGAAFFDPFGRVEEMTAANRAQAMSNERQQARIAIQELRQAGGPNYRGYYDAEFQLGRARGPAEVARLVAEWKLETRRLQASQDQLNQASGGLVDGLPKDVTEATAHLAQLRDSAAAAGLLSDGASATIADAQLYLSLPTMEMVAKHEAVIGALNAAAGGLQKRLDSRHQVEDQLDKASNLLGDLRRMGGAEGDFGGRLAQGRQDLAAAQTEDGLAAVVGSSDALVRDLQAARSKRQQELAAAASTPVSTAACIDGSPAQLIVIHLATQQLVAYDNGCPWLQTTITTGRSALPTDRGTFHIFYKTPVYKMVSPWQKPSPFWYPDTYVYNAMEFVGDGTFIHSAEWQPVSSYGAGSQNGPYASHGCVHVPSGTLQRLYNWAPIGTTVVVGD
jgi:lipoprotein-anchoring transpeptidase ErfK/SrfK